METIITFNSHLRISKENFKKIESIFHPRIRKNIRQFERKDLGNMIYYSFPYFHGCGKLNKNKLNKRIIKLVKCVNPHHQKLVSKI